MAGEWVGPAVAGVFAAIGVALGLSGVRRSPGSSGDKGSRGESRWVAPAPLAAPAPAPRQRRRRLRRCGTRPSPSPPMLPASRSAPAGHRRRRARSRSCDPLTQAARAGAGGWPVCACGRLGRGRHAAGHWITEQACTRAPRPCNALRSPVQGLPAWHIGHWAGAQRLQQLAVARAGRARTGMARAAGSCMQMGVQGCCSQRAATRGAARLCACRPSCRRPCSGRPREPPRSVTLRAAARAAAV